MHSDDMRPYVPGDVPAAIGLLTRLPIPVDGDAAQARGARAAWAYPLAGAVIGTIAVLMGALALWLGLSPAIAAALALACQIVTTGAMHEDGLADSADGLWGGWTKDRRLEIMKDSRIGTYGVLALGLSLLLRWLGITALLGTGHWAGVIAVAALSRATMPALMAALPPARSGGLSRSVGRPGTQAVLTGAALAAGIGLALTGADILPLLLMTGLAALSAAMTAKAKIGGQTGDILGATQQLSEIAGLLTLTALL